MKIHIDTSTPQDKAKADKITKKPASTSSGASAKKAASGKSGSSASAKKSGSGVGTGTSVAMPTLPNTGFGVAGQIQSQQSQQSQKPLPTSPPKEPKAPDEVKQARAQQTTVLQKRQQREVAGKVDATYRDVDAGAGFFPPISPLL